MNWIIAYVLMAALVIGVGILAVYQLRQIRKKRLMEHEHNEQLPNPPRPNTR